MSHILRNAVIHYVCAAIVGLPLTLNGLEAHAQAEFQQSVAEGSDVGSQIRLGVQPDFDPVTGQVRYDGHDVIQYEQPADGMSWAKGTYGDQDAFAGVIANTANTLHGADSNSGNAYRALMGGIHTPRPSLTNDPMVVNGETALRDSFNDPLTGGCYVTQQTQITSGEVIHVPEYRYCNRVAEQVQCEVERDISIREPVGAVSGGTGGYASLEFYDIAFGGSSSGDPDTCQIAEFNTSVPVLDPAGITSATISGFVHSGHYQLYVNEALVSTTGAMPEPPANPQDPFTCDTGSGGGGNGTNVTGYFGGSSVHIRVVAAGQGDASAFGNIRLKLNSSEVTTTTNPPGCHDEIMHNPDPEFLGEGDTDWVQTGSVTDQASTEYWECTDADYVRPVTSPSGVTYNVNSVDYGFIGPLFRDEPLGPGSPHCYKAQFRPIGIVTHECYVDGNGNTQCPVVDYNGGEAIDECGTLASTPGCVFLGSECTDYFLGSCIAWEDKYDCGTTTDTQEYTTVDTVVCPGDIRCQGEECLVPRETESSEDFQQAATAMELVKYAHMDGQCAQDGGNDCRIFGGKRLRCKTVLGGLQDCCDQDPPTLSMADYMKLGTTSWRLLEDTKVGQAVSGTVKGAWDSFSSPVSNLASEISKPFVSAWDSFVGSSTAASGGASGAQAASAIEGATSATTPGIVQSLTNHVVNWAGQTFGPSIIGNSGSLFIADGAGNVALNVSGNMAAAFLNYVMIAYAIYTIVMILINIIWPCTEDEFKLAANRQLKLCHKTGRKRHKKLGITYKVTQSFCCFNSPLARIIHQQVRGNPAQPINKPWGGYSGDCSGFTVGEFSNIDFRLVDLSEWIALLQLGDRLPSTLSPEELASRYGASSAGSKIMADGQRSATTVDRTKALIDNNAGSNPNALDQRREALQENARACALNPAGAGCD